jgi:T-complex protein 1 subunit alpha
MLLDGEEHPGQDVPTYMTQLNGNCYENFLRSVGLDKMLVDGIGDVTITNDGATILALLDIMKTSCSKKYLLRNCKIKEVGGTTSVVVQQKLLKRANRLVKSKIHPTIYLWISSCSCKEACKYIKSNLVVSFHRVLGEII